MTKVVSFYMVAYSNGWVHLRVSDAYTRAWQVYYTGGIVIGKIHRLDCNQDGF